MTGVVHSTPVWLSQTMIWLYTQIRHLPDRIDNRVVCDVVRNVDQFSTVGVVGLDQDPAAWRFLAARSTRIRRWRRREALVREAREIDARVLHSHFGNRGWGDLSAAARAGLAHVVTFYGYDCSRLPRVEPRWRSRYRELFDAADLFLCEGPHLGRTLVDLGCPEAKVRVHHLAVDLDRLPYRPRRWRTDETLRVLLAGSFVEKKGMPYAIEALGRLRNEVDLEITIIGDSKGQDRSRSEKRRILDTLRSTGLDGRTRLLGYRPYEDLIAEAYRHHVFLSPSVTAEDGDTEGGAPVILIDMAATGMPVVGTTHCDIPEIVEDGVTGFLAPERDVDGLAECLRRLLGAEDRWPTVCAAARDRVEREFNAATQGERLGRLYESLAAGPAEAVLAS